jgi:hypothetical protein
MLFTVPSAGGLTTTLLFSVFKNAYKKSAKQEKPSLFMKNIFAERKQTKLQSEKT